MKSLRQRTASASIALLLVTCIPAVAAAAVPSAGSPSAEGQAAAPSSTAEPTLIQPDELAKLVTSGEAPKPIVIQVGFRALYVQAHIPGSEYTGAASTAEGLRQLRQRVEKLPRSQFIVLYCGCCPWVRCPNVHPAWDALHGMGFTNVKVLYIGQNFGKDWVDHGYPVAKGE